MFKLVEMLIENKETVLLQGDLGRCFRCRQAFLSLLHHLAQLHRVQCPLYTNGPRFPFLKMFGMFSPSRPNKVKSHKGVLRFVWV